MGGGWRYGIGIMALVLVTSACARKDRIAPCAPGDGLVSSYAASQSVTLPPFAAIPVTAADPCGPLRPLNAAPRAPNGE